MLQFQVTVGHLMLIGISKHMKFSEKPPLIHRTTKQYYEHKQLTELRSEFERIMFIRDVVEQYISKKPKK